MKSTYCYFKLFNSHDGIKKEPEGSFLIWNIKSSDEQYLYYLFITYIVTSKPKRISVAAGFVHMVKVLNKINE